MKKIEITTVGEAKKIISGFALIQIMLALQNGHTITVVDEYKQIEYVFRTAEKKEIDTT